MKVLVFTNLWPSSAVPQNGSFVRERVLRLRDRMDFEFEVVHPLPLYPRLRGDSLQARHSRLPSHEVLDGVRIAYPRYFHVPRFGVGRQAIRMARGSRKAFAECVQRLRPDLCDAHYLYPDGCAAIELATEHGLPCLVTARGSDVNVLGRVDVVKAQYRSQLPRAARVMTVSAALGRELRTQASLAEESVLTMRNGVDLDRFRVGSGDPELRVVCLARLSGIKRVDLLIRAMRHVPERYRLDLIGDGPERAALTKLRDASGLAQRVNFLGELDRDAVARELERGGVFAIASRNEGWPNALMEALAAGMFAVCSEVGGIPEILGAADSEVGTCLDVTADDTAWGAALTRACESLERGGRAAGAGARRRAEALSWDATLADLQRVFEEAAKT